MRQAFDLGPFLIICHNPLAQSRTSHQTHIAFAASFFVCVCFSPHHPHVTKFRV